jgi:CBS domain-containing protein
MRVRDVMTEDVECIDCDATLQEAARLMAELDVGVLPVLDGDDCVGIVTDRDIVVRGIASGLDGQSRVEEVMTCGVVTCFEDDSLRRAESLMEEFQVRRLVVTDADEQLVGIVSLADLALDVGPRLAGAVLQAVSEPSLPSSVEQPHTEPVADPEEAR